MARSVCRALVSLKTRARARHGNAPFEAFRNERRTRRMAGIGHWAYRYWGADPLHPHANPPCDARQRSQGRQMGEPEMSKRLPKEPLRCCPGKGARQGEPFCRAARASITSAAPTTLTLPTHDLVAGAAWLFEQHGYPTRRRAVFQGFWQTSTCKFLNLQSSWTVTDVIATGSLGRSRPSRGAVTIRSTTSIPPVTCPNSV